MDNEIIPAGHLMAAESSEAMQVFCQSAMQQVDPMNLQNARAIYTIARGSSDAAANILSYEFMRELGIPVTSLPPSVFSLGAGVALQDAAALVVSQSGASDDLVRSARGAADHGAQVLAITNVPGSPVEAASHAVIPINAGPEKAVPATKTVIGSIAAGMALLGAISPTYQTAIEKSVACLQDLETAHSNAKDIQAALLRSRHVYVVGRDTGYGAAHEIALKLKECCALHAEPYSASEVLHGPLQLATNPLLVLILDTGTAQTQDSLDQAEARFRESDSDVYRISPADLGLSDIAPAAAAAVLLAMMYPVILATALSLGLNPDAPETLSKVTQTT